ncbi:MAG: 4a-hydroxytetrahydrobiopterin dehydratase [Allosphingosinicella sp.]|uniref:4a-hydroxytetrahydrobiopterin dehydratase n=1 Tax=Allosphingosinicella sp. TaxID=2823234 RepID=UPI00394D5792
MAEALDETEIAAALAHLPEWSRADEGRAIARTFRFADFAEAFAFMTRVAMAAEKADHHPDWSNSWNRVEVTLTTHSAGGLTARDFALAEKIDRIAAQLALTAARD